MNRDDLMRLLWGEHPAPVATYRNIEENDAENPFVVHTRAVIGLRPRRYVVRREFAPGAGMGEAATTINTTEIAWLGVDPEHRGQGHARDLLAGATQEAATHALTKFMTTHAPNGCAGFYRHFGFKHPKGSWPGFYVFPLTDEPWPSGLVMR